MIGAIDITYNLFIYNLKCEGVLNYVDKIYLANGVVVKPKNSINIKRIIPFIFKVLIGR